MPDGKLYRFTNKRTGQVLEFRSDVEPDKAMISQVAAEQRAHKEAAEKGKITAAQAGRGAEQEYLKSQGVSDFVTKYPRLTSALIGTKELGTGIAEGAVGLAQLPAIIGEELVRDIIQPRKQLEAYKSFFRGTPREITEAIPGVPETRELITPTEEGVAYPRLKTVGRIGGMLALGAGVGAAVRTPKVAPRIAEVPKVEAPTGVPSKVPMSLEDIISEVPKVEAPIGATFAEEVAAAKVKAGLIKGLSEQLKGIPKKEQTTIVSRTLGRDVKSLNELTETELRTLSPEQAPAEIPTEIPVVEAPRQYGPDRIARMQAEDIDYATGRSKPLITPPPETALSMREPTTLTRPEPTLIEAMPKVEPPIQRWSNEPILEVIEPDMSLYGRGKLIDETIPKEFKPPYRQLPPELVEEPLELDRPTFITDKGKYIPEERVAHEGIELVEGPPIAKPLRRPVPTKVTEPQIPPETPIPAKMLQQKAAPPQGFENAIKEAGAKYEGEAEGLVYFTDPQTRSTLVLKPQDVTVENVTRRMSESRAQFESAKPESPLTKLSNDDLMALHEVEPTANTLAELQKRKLAPEVTKLPPVEPTEPMEFGRPFEEKLSKTERQRRKVKEKSDAILRRLIQEEEGFLDVPKLVNTLRSKDPETGALKWVEEKPFRHALRDYVTTSIETAIKKYGGIQGENVARMIREVRTLERNIAGELIDKFKTASEGLNEAELKNLAEHLGTERRVPAINDKVARAASTIAANNKVVAIAAKAVELTLKRKGKKVPFEPRDPEGFYWHFEYTKEFWNWLEKDPKTRATVLRDIMADGKSQFEAEQLLRMARKYGEKRVSAEYSRELDALAEKYRQETGEPAFSTDVNVMRNYYEQMADRIAKAKILGVRDIGEVGGPLQKQLEAAAMSGKDASQMYRYLSRILERDTPPETYKYKVAAGISNAMVATFLQNFPIINTVQLPMIGVYAPVRPFIRGMFEAAIDYKGASKRALQSGSTLEATKVMQDFGGKVLNKYYLGQASERFNRTFADNVGRATATYWFDILKKNPANAKIAGKLTDLTLIPVEQLLKMDSLSETALHRAGYNMSRITQGTVHPEDLPYAWSNSPMSKLYFIFQRYAFATTRNMWQEILREPVKAPIKSFILLGAAGEVVGDLKKFIAEGTEGVKHRGEWLGIDNPMVSRLLDDLMQGWALGMVADFMAGLWVRGEVNKSVSLDVVDTIGRNVNRILHGKFEPIGRELLQRAPIPIGVGKRLQYELLPSERQKGMKKKGAFRTFKKRSMNVAPPISSDLTVAAPA